MLAGHLHGGGRPIERVAQELGCQCQGAENLPQQWDLPGVCGEDSVSHPPALPKKVGVTKAQQKSRGTLVPKEATTIKQKYIRGLCLIGNGLKALLAWSPLMVTSLHSFTSTLALNDPLQTLFQLMSGRIPQAATVPFNTPAS